MACNESNQHNARQSLGLRRLAGEIQGGCQGDRGEIAASSSGDRSESILKKVEAGPRWGTVAPTDPFGDGHCVCLAHTPTIILDTPGGCRCGVLIPRWYKALSYTVLRLACYFQFLILKMSRRAPTPYASFLGHRIVPDSFDSPPKHFVTPRYPAMPHHPAPPAFPSTTRPMPCRVAHFPWVPSHLLYCTNRYTVIDSVRFIYRERRSIRC